MLEFGFFQPFGNRHHEHGLGGAFHDALGNAADRLMHGAVADFFSFHYAGYHWYIFNIADVAIGAGVVGLLLDWAMNPASRKG